MGLRCSIREKKRQKFWLQKPSLYRYAVQQVNVGYLVR